MERAYKTMNSAGVLSLVLGIIVLIVGVSAGVLAIVNGSLLMKRKSDLEF